MSFSFGNPWALLALLLLPLAVWVSLRRRRRRAGLLFPATERAGLASVGRRSHAALWLALLRAFALACLVVALARPRFGSETHETASSGIDIMMAVDISGSMLALDLQYLGQTATRLEVVKAVMEDFIERRPSDRIGIVAFASEPYLVSPVTLHHDWLKENLARIEVGIVPSTGTSIGPPIGMAANRLGNLEESKSRIIILLTDGKDQPPPPIEPLVYARAAKALGVKVYTIAIGTGGIVRTFVPDGRGGLRRDFSGRPLVTTAQHELDEDILRRIAEETDARFYRARDSEELQRIYQEIDQLEKTEVRLVYHTDYEDAFFPPLASGLILLVLEQLLAATRLRTLP